MLRPQWRATILLSAMRPYTEVVCCVRLDRSLGWPAERDTEAAPDTDQPEPEMAQEKEPDLLDELTIWTLEQGGDVVVVPTERMPTGTGAAAIYRF